MAVSHAWRRSTWVRQCTKSLSAPRTRPHILFACRLYPCHGLLSIHTSCPLCCPSWSLPLPVPIAVIPPDAHVQLSIPVSMPAAGAGEGYFPSPPPRPRTPLPALIVLKDDWHERPPEPYLRSTNAFSRPVLFSCSCTAGQYIRSKGAKIFKGRSSG